MSRVEFEAFDFNFLDSIEGHRFSLERLKKSHVTSLTAECGDPAVWEHQYESWGDYKIGGVALVVRKYLYEMDQQQKFVYAIVDNEENRAIGTTRCKSFRTDGFVVEMATWIGEKWFRSGANPQSKLLFLSTLFDRSKCELVDFYCDVESSATWLLKAMKAKHEATLPGHWKRGGKHIDVDLYLVSRDNWPAVKVNLERIIKSKLGV